MTQEEAILNFRGVVLCHPRMTDAVQGLCARLMLGVPPRMVILLGPTGIGKSTVLDVAQKKVAEEKGQALRVDCLSPGRHGFEFGFGRRSLVWRLAASLRAAGPHRSGFTEADAMGQTIGRVVAPGTCGGSGRCGPHEGAVRGGGDVAGLDRRQHLRSTTSPVSERGPLIAVKKMSGDWPLRHNGQSSWHLGAHPQPNCRLQYSESVPGCVSPRPMGRR